MKLDQAIQQYVTQFNRHGLFLLRFTNEAQLLEHNPKTFAVVYENDSIGEPERDTLRKLREDAIVAEVVHVQSVICAEGWPGKLDTEADVVLEVVQEGDTRTLVPVKWRAVDTLPEPIEFTEL
ncbi:hypothetical protein pEaSNUABM42_00223 [Erwinia phage pEa_SNUABM_42]|nr:hypothetical protein pEaSNUABM43_00224 [Erwinia phage pEa_SNUABM_43]QVW55540.1 hypothetical protein pEaSNUABM42_00223 [Erwinia phage pEa_SNUABM_42]